MPALFDTKVIFPADSDQLVLEVKIHIQPSVTRIYVDGTEILNFSGDKIHDLGMASNYKNKKIRIHTSVQDKSTNTDDIKVLHLVKYGNKSAKREVNTSASEEGEIFDIFTDIMVF